MVFQKKIVSKWSKNHYVHDPSNRLHTYFIFLKLVIPTEFSLHILVGQFKFVRWIKYLYWSSVFGDSSCSVIMDHNRYVIEEVTHIAWIIQNESWFYLFFRISQNFSEFSNWDFPPYLSSWPINGPWYGYHSKALGLN